MMFNRKRPRPEESIQLQIDLPDPEVSVPVIVDGLPELGDPKGDRGGATDGEVDLVRCVYFTVTADDPSPGWTLEVGGGRLPFLLLGLQGIIFRPHGRDTFTSPRLIADMIQAVEETGEVFVETEYLWFPLSFLQDAHGMRGDVKRSEGAGFPVRGSVFRIAFPLFLEAFRTARDGTEFGTFLPRLAALSEGRETPAAVYMLEETAAFREWSEIVVKENAEFTAPGR